MQPYLRSLQRRPCHLYLGPGAGDSGLYRPSCYTAAAACYCRRCCRCCRHRYRPRYLSLNKSGIVLCKNVGFMAPRLGS